MILTETKIINQYYFCNRMEYNMVCSQAIMTAYRDVQGLVGMIVQDRPHGWSIELERFHGTNVVSYKVVTGKCTQSL